MKRRINALDIGMNDILPKPFTKEGLFDMLDVCPLVFHLHCEILLIGDCAFFFLIETLDASEGDPAATAEREDPAINRDSSDVGPFV